MLNKHVHEILIVGAGIIGLSLARQLQKLNIPYRLIEKRNAMPEEDMGIALPANAVRALRYMELGEKIEASAHRINKIICATEAGKILSTASLDEPPLNQDWFVALGRKKLHEILSADISNVQFGTTVEQIHFIDNGVSVKFNHSSKRENFSLIVGADGINSRIRRLVFSDNHLLDLNVTMWRWINDYDTSELQPTYLLGTRDVFIVYPISNNKVFCYAHVFDPDDMYSHLTHSSEVLHNCFAQYGGIAKQLLNVLPDDHNIISGRLRSFEHPLFGKDRIALIGDAAHACSFALQQGAASGFEDVIVLSELLHEFSIPDAISYYERFRKERINWTLLASDAPMKMLGNMDETAVAERNKRIRKNGPLNVQGWKTLFATDPLLEIQTFIARKKQFPEMKEAQLLTAKP